MKTHIPDDRVARMDEAWAYLGISARTGYYWIEQGILPPPLALGPRARGYRMSTLSAFLASLRTDLKVEDVPRFYPEFDKKMRALAARLKGKP